MDVSEDGIYVYDRDSLTWTKLKLDEPFVPREDGLHIIYFKNKRCPGCRAFDRIWLEYVNRKKYDDNIKKFAVVQCTNFFHECSDSSAADTFILYLVLETPQIMIIVSENGTPVYIERETGIDNLDGLETFIKEIHYRINRYVEEDPEEEHEEALYLDLDFENPKNVVAKLKKLIFEEKDFREVCDEEGCRIIIT